MRVDRLMKKNADVLLPLELLIDGWKNGKELEILHVDSEVLRCTRSSFFVMRINSVDFNMKNATM